MKIVAVSDLHGHLPNIPACDLLLCAGDVSPLGDHSPQAQKKWLLQHFYPYLLSVPARYVVWIAGNHDAYLGEQRPPFADPRLIYLVEEEVEIEGVKIYGCPWSIPKGNALAYSLRADDSSTHHSPFLRLSPADIWLVHSPPYQCRDKIASGEHVGSHVLRQMIEQHQPSLVVCGHIHESAGRSQIGETLVINASLVDQRYGPVNKPVELSYQDGQVS